MQPVHFPIGVAAIVIDLDGTLLHSAPQLAEAANRMLREIDYAPVSQELLASYIGNGIGWLVKRALTGEMHATPDAALYEHALPIFQKHYSDLLLGSKPYDGAIEGLEAMRAAGFRLGCITNKSTRFTGPLLEGAGVTAAAGGALALIGQRAPRDLSQRESLLLVVLVWFAASTFGGLPFLLTPHFTRSSSLSER